MGLIALAVIHAWISNHLLNKIENEITYPFPKFKGCTVEFGREWISNFIPRFMMDVITYPCQDPNCSDLTSNNVRNITIYMVRSKRNSVNMYILWIVFKIMESVNMFDGQVTFIFHWSWQMFTDPAPKIRLPSRITRIKAAYNQAGVQV